MSVYSPLMQKPGPMKRCVVPGIANAGAHRPKPFLTASHNKTNQKLEKSTDN
jgi:hypothetical protein